MSNNWKRWGDVFNHYRGKGEDHAWAAELADRWEVRKNEKINRKTKREYKAREMPTVGPRVFLPPTFDGKKPQG